VFDLDADHVGHRRRVDKVDVGRAKFAVVVVFPVLHEDADDLVALLFEQVRRHRGVHASAQTHNDPLRGCAFLTHKSNYPRRPKYRGFAGMMMRRGLSAGLFWS
jgi:hypothetical protein